MQERLTTQPDPERRAMGTGGDPQTGRPFWLLRMQVQRLYDRLTEIRRRMAMLRLARGRSGRSRRTWQRLAQEASALLLAAGLLLTPAGGPVYASGGIFAEQTGAANPFDGVDVEFTSAPVFVDVDGDGDMDAFIGEIDGTIHFYRNDGTPLAPVFSEQTGTANPLDGVDVGYNSAPVFVDVDADGDLDVFIGNVDGNINFYRNDGTPLAPVFSAQTGAANPFDGVDVDIKSTPSFADIDADGDLDAFIGEIGGMIFYYRNDGTALAPVFSEQTGAANPLDGVDVVYGYSAPTFADIDGDGDLDAFIGEYNSTILYYKNTGTALVPVFSEQTGAANPFDGVSFGGGFSIPTFADIDGDGDLDAFIGEWYGTIFYYKNTGANTVDPDFRAQTGSANPLDGYTGGRPTFADIDGDGDLDAFMGDYNGYIFYFKNTGTALAPVFSPQTGTDNPFDGVRVFGVVDVGYDTAPSFVDIDGDGDLDAFIGERYGTIHFFRNDGTALAPAFSLQAAANPFAGVDVSFFSIPTFADIDGDGDMDAFIGEEYTEMNYYKNIGTPLAPVFSPQTGAANPFDSLGINSHNAIAFADIDGDGDLDAFTGEEGGEILYYKNTGTSLAPVFSPQTGTDNPFDGVTGFYFTTPTFADIDGDGDLDLFSGEESDFILYFENTHCSFTSENSGALANGSVFHFGNGESRVTVTVNSVGDPALTSIDASCTPNTHPNTIATLDNNVFWTLTPNSGAGSTTPFSIDLEFRFKSPDADDKICRYTGSAWDCSQTAFTGNTLIRTGVSEFSDWTFNATLVPTAVTIADFSSQTAWGSGPKLTWETAGESGLSGFHIWRGSASAAETRLTDTLIGAFGGLNGSEYTWQDSASFGWGQRAYYWLEAVEADGSSSFTGPVEVLGIGRLFLPSVGR